jgi:uncharacterized membrane protein
MLILLPLLAKLSPDQRVILGRTLVVLGAIFLAVSFTGHPWLLVLSVSGLLIGITALVSARRSRRQDRYSSRTTA